jgi:hypothetical protein
MSFMRVVSMPMEALAVSSSFMHRQKSPYREEMRFFVTMRRKTVTTKVVSRFVSFAMPVKPREPPSVSEILSELSKKTRTSIPNPRVRSRGSRRGPEDRYPDDPCDKPGHDAPGKKGGGEAKTLSSPGS